MKREARNRILSFLIASFSSSSSVISIGVALLVSLRFGVNK